ncbi:hypothetical protein [Asanoa ishikariensis]|uniref:hypothetical protein n=1 Tax=Asanoa ishikariensis TaxID=137265 RepID=UPI0015A31D46|nr:hypothetical protein [Asanoa ishikariensis]
MPMFGGPPGPERVAADGGGAAQAALTPAVGADAVASVLTAALTNLAARSLRLAQVNGYPALLMELDTVLAVRLVTDLYSVRNPLRLSRLRRETALRR